MGFIAPKERKHLSADALFGLMRSGFANIPDHRSDDAGIPFTDARMSAFAMFSLTSPSLLAFDKQRAEGNLSTIYGIERRIGKSNGIFALVSAGAHPQNPAAWTPQRLWVPLPAFASRLAGLVGPQEP